MAAILCPLAVSDLRAPYPELAYCLDASPYGGGYVEAFLPRPIAMEAWRLKEQRGAYRHLESAHEAVKRKLSLVDLCLQEGDPSDSPKPFSFDCLCVGDAEELWSNFFAEKGASALCLDPILSPWMHMRDGYYIP